MTSFSAEHHLTDLLDQAQSTAQRLSRCCLHANASVQLVPTLRHCASVATTSRSLCTTATTESQELVDLCRTTGQRLQALRASQMTSPKMFVQIQDLVHSYSEIQAQIKDCQLIQTQATQVVQQSDRMLQRLETAVGSMPASEEDDNDTERHVTDRTLPMDGSKDPFGDDNEEDDDEEATRTLVGMLQTVDVDLADLENSASKTRGGQLDLFSASSLGAQIFEASAQQGEVCRTLCSNMDAVCGSIQNVVAAQDETASCCSQFHALTHGLSRLLACQRLVQVLHLAAQAVVRIMTALATLIRESWDRMQQFAEQFAATKKIGKFMGKVNTALQQGTIPTGAFKSFMKQSKDAVGARGRGFLLR